MSETKNLKQAVDNNAIEAKEIALTIQNIQEAALDLDTILDRKVRQKYPDRYIARPSKEEALSSQHKGWQLLKYDSATQTLKVVTSYDEATTNKSGSPLCWRDKRIQDYINNEERKVREQSNRKAQGENSKTQAEALQNTLSGMSGGKIKAKALEDGED